MTTFFRKVVFATALPLRMVRLQRLLRAAGIDCPVVVMDPQQWCGTLDAQSGCLVFIDARSAPSWEGIAEARRQAAAARFVLCARRVTPGQVRAAIEAGMDGVLSTGLALEDAARALLQICEGERRFRFEPASIRTVRARAASPPPEFDTLWMFGIEGV